jgi:hypothetical protein
MNKPFSKNFVFYHALDKSPFSQIFIIF